jgi:hypothetical protein
MKQGLGEGKASNLLLHSPQELFPLTFSEGPFCLTYKQFL